MVNFNEMTTSTRVMIVVSVIMFVIGFLAIVTGNGGGDVGFGMSMWLLVMIYWGYRFVKDGTNIR